MILQKWGTLEANHFFNNELEFTNNKSEKLSLPELFQKTIKELENSELDISLDTVIPAFQKIDKCYKEKNINKESPDLTSSYEKINDLLASKVSKKYEGNYRELVNSSITLKKNNQTAEAGFIDRCLECSISALEKYPTPKGIVYEIINEKGCTGYLIGTLHMLNFSYLETNAPWLLQKIKDSDELITELGTSYQNASNEELELMRTIMDIGLSELAINNKVNILGFETLEWQKKFFAEAQQLTKSKDYLEKFSPYLLNRYRHAPIHQLYESIEAWQHGNIEELKLIVTKLIGPKAKEVGLKEINKKWLSSPSINLINRLEKMDKPICIAVGVGHLVGKTGFIKALENTQKFQINKIDR